MQETKTRSIIKACSWRVVGSTMTGFIVYVLTGNILASSAILGVDMVVRLLVYFLHERIWSAIKWGYRNE
jgi:uncharacterized membrane protein